MQEPIKAVKSLIKVPGGKRTLIPTITSYLPKDFNKVHQYVEPFLGGGSVFLYMATAQRHLKSYYLNELNPDVHLSWTMALEAGLKKIELLHSMLLSYEENHQKDDDFYYKIRDSFNSPAAQGEIERAAMFLYLNKACFNGLIRYNSKGHFNSPKGSYKNPPISDIESLLDIKTLALEHVSMSLLGISSNIMLENLDFQDFLEDLVRAKAMTKKTFVYLDPPYIPESPTASFTSYNPGNFTDYDQRRLAACLHMLNKLGARFMLSNSDTPLTREIFSGFNCIEVKNIRNISCKKEGRGKTTELLITNY